MSQWQKFTDRPRYVKSRAICVAEDRKSCEHALKLLLVSLSRHNAGTPIVVFYPPADQGFIDWVEALDLENISVRKAWLRGASGWNVKPQMMLALLNEGNQEILWIDSDILVTGNVFVAIGQLPDDTLVAAEECLQNQDETKGLRARLWGFLVKREFKFPLNTGVIRVTQRHVRLLVRWKELLESPKYLDAQTQPMSARPRHMFSDQDVLTALLCSEEFHDVPVKILRRGHDIIQYYGEMGFTLAERIICMLKGMPTFLHQQGSKPWHADPDEKLKGLRGRFVTAYLDLSPYTIVAIDLNTGPIHAWMRPRSRLSSLLRAIGFRYPPLTGLPLAIVFDLERLVRLPRQLVRNVVRALYPHIVGRREAGQRAVGLAKIYASEGADPLRPRSNLVPVKAFANFCGTMSLSRTSSIIRSNANSSSLRGRVRTLVAVLKYGFAVSIFEDIFTTAARGWGRRDHPTRIARAGVGSLLRQQRLVFGKASQRNVWLSSFDFGRYVRLGRYSDLLPRLDAFAPRTASRRAARRF